MTNGPTDEQAVSRSRIIKIKVRSHVFLCCVCAFCVSQSSCGVSACGDVSFLCVDFFLSSLFGSRAVFLSSACHVYELFSYGHGIVLI